MSDKTRPEHYRKQSMEVIDMMEKIYGLEKVKAFCELNAFKYRMRAGYKEGVKEDIKKAMWYEDKLISLDNNQRDYIKDLSGERVYVGDIVKTHKAFDDVDDAYFTLPKGAQVCVLDIDPTLNWAKIQIGSSCRFVEGRDIELYTE